MKLSLIPRIGLGYDLHQLAFGRKLILGGISIPFDKGLLGHSDADCLTHAITDAMLGAAGLGDIGTQFPDNDPAYKDANSIGLLKKAFHLVQTAGFTLGNIDATVIAQNPKLGPYIPQMKELLAEALETLPENIAIKATTNEGVDSIGAGEAIATHAVCLLFKDPNK